MRTCWTCCEHARRNELNIELVELVVNYNPQANRAERFHRSLGSLMTANLDRTDVNWVSKLQAIKLAYNSKVNRSTGVTPALAFLGHEVKIPISLMIPAPEDQPSQYKWLSQLQETYTKIFNRMYATQAQTHRANAKLYSNKKAPFAVGAVVWYFAKRQVADKPPKLTQKWSGLSISWCRVLCPLYRVT